MQRQPPITIPLGQGPDQSVARLLRDPTQVLSQVLDGDLTKEGGVRKARGFSRITTAATTHGDTPEAVFVSLGIDRGELVLVGRDRCYGIAAPSASVDGAALVLRGPSMVGQISITTIHGSAMGDE